MENNIKQYYIEKSQKKRTCFTHRSHFSRPQTAFKTDEEALVHYFQLKLLNLEKLNSQWQLEDGRFAEVLCNARGLRILRQDPTECLFSFICSSNNNIKRISSMVESLCELYGEKLTVNLGLAQKHSEACTEKIFYDFPSISSIYKNYGHDDVVSALRRRNFGYRAPYVAQTVKHLIGKFGSDQDNIEMELLKMRDRNYEECAEFLVSLPGVGPKVADCVSLMSLDKNYVVPVDRHVLRLTVRHYMPQLRSCRSLSKVARKSISKNIFGDDQPMDNINYLNDDLLSLIFEQFDLQTVHKSGLVCRKWCRLSDQRWSLLRTLNFFHLFPNGGLPRGKYLNKALHFALKRCGRRLDVLNMHDPEPVFRLIKFNENSFKIIGKFCPQLSKVDFSHILLLNDFLLYFVRYVDCRKIRWLNLNSSFNHYCIIYDGLSALYEACPILEVLDISNSLNAKVRDCRELWPSKLKQVHVDNAWALTSYSLVSLANCCPDLTIFSMNGRMGGMDAGIEYILTHCSKMSRLFLIDYPVGSETLGENIKFLPQLTHLQLGSSDLACDHVIYLVSRFCPNLQLLECNTNERYTADSRLTDHSLFALADFALNLQELHLNFRQSVTDDGLIYLFSGRTLLKKLSLAGCREISDLSLSILAEKSSLNLRQINLSTTNLSSNAIINLSEKWLINRKLTENHETEKSTLEVFAHEVAVDFEDIRRKFELNDKNLHNFTIAGCKKFSVQLYGDVLTSMFN
uniref:DNA-(apurinic or apyrimidinic site) lyase n=1 Tax=Romanomermis culicivorax TaxID=13658 RepID=A0A915HHN4_ROMCU